MTLLLDSSILMAIEKKDAVIIEKLEQLTKAHPRSPCISFATQVEFLVGVHTLSGERMQCAFDLLSEFPVLHTSDDTAELLASLKYSYQKSGRKKSFTDMLIAAHALEHKLTLVTLDKDFKDITEIKKIIL